MAGLAEAILESERVKHLSDEEIHLEYIADEVGGVETLMALDAVRVLDAADMHPRSSWAYQDPDEPTTSRELDVWSYRQLLRDETNKVFVTARFLVECKQSSLPYVGIGHNLPE